jgi:hypothetical protein
VSSDCSGCQLGGRRLGIARPILTQLGRVGIEAKADLTAALFDERRESIRKIGQLGPSL